MISSRSTRPSLRNSSLINCCLGVKILIWTNLWMNWGKIYLKSDLFNILNPFWYNSYFVSRTNRTITTRFDDEIFELLYSLHDFCTFKTLILDYKEFKLNETEFSSLNDCFTITKLQWFIKGNIFFPDGGRSKPTVSEHQY